MADKPTKGEAQDNQGQSGTDNFPTYQDEAGLKGTDKPKEDSPAATRVEFNHGEESPAAKAEREAAEKDGLASLGLPAQMLPENQK